MLINILFSNNLNADQAVIIFLISLVVFMFSLAMHEFAHGFAAYKMGDDTPKLAGRLTLNPFSHLDLTGFICFAIFGVGWAKPVPINPIKFKKYRKGIRWVSISGVLVNVLLGLLAAGIHAVLLATVGIPNTAMQYVYYALDTIMWVNSFLAMFNILPIYPLDGFNFITSFMKSSNKFIHFSIRNGLKIVIGLLLASTLIEFMFNIDIFAYYLSVLYEWVFSKIAFIGV